MTYCRAAVQARSAEVVDGFERRFGIVILEGYVLSETASSTTFNTSAETRRVYMSVDRVNVMRGYHGDPEATEQAFTRGWSHTGDVGYLDADGFCYVVDRKKELILRGGFNVYPREVEDVLYTHPAVAEAAVVGVPHDRLGQEVMAIVVLRPGRQATEADIIDDDKERAVAFKYPRLMEFRTVLPKNAAGKILKKELRPWNT